MQETSFAYMYFVIVFISKIYKSYIFTIKPIDKHTGSMY